MKKIRILALLVMTVACTFLFTEQNVAEANYCKLPGEECTVDGSCCTKICCNGNDTREDCFLVVVNHCA